MKVELEEKILAMIQQNKQRMKFIERLNSILQKYNHGAEDIDHLFNDLVDLSKDLQKEESRGEKEGLSEEELAIFDLLSKDNLNSENVEKVKSVSRKLLEKLKSEKIVLDWREKESTRAGVKTAISKCYIHLYLNRSMTSTIVRINVWKSIILCMSATNK